LKGYRRYFLNKLGWFLITFVCAFILNFILPRLMPGDPVAGIVARMAQGMTNATGVQALYQKYTELFGTNKPMIEQFFIYIRNVAHGDFGYSFSAYPRTVADNSRRSSSAGSSGTRWARWRLISGAALTKCSCRLVFS
jgi:peptide/nickel transport system permease protein